MPVHMEEDSKGLLTVSKISRTKAGDEAIQLVADGVASHMSIGYDTIKGEDETVEEKTEDGQARGKITAVASRRMPTPLFACGKKREGPVLLSSHPRCKPATAIMEAKSADLPIE